MVSWRLTARSAGLLVLVAAAAACSDTTRLPEAPATGALTAAPVRVQQTGSGPAQVDKDSVSFQLDDSGSLVMRLRLTSTASRVVTFALRASLFDAKGAVIGDATGGEINVQPGSITAAQLNGPAPNGTIASTVVEVTVQAAPTPTQSTPGSQLGTPGTS